MRNFWNDLRFGLRLIVKSPGASLIAVLALGLGIGANTAIFSVADGILLHPLPYTHLSRMLEVSEVPPHSPPNSTNSVSAFNYATWKRQAHGFQAMAAYDYDSVNLSGAGMPVMVQAAEVSANFFKLLPATPLRGRTFLPGEDRPGHDREAILSRTLWQHQFAGNPAIVGQTIELNQQAYTVIGILPNNATMPQGAQMWLPLALTPQQLNNRTSHNLQVIGKLAPGATLASAQAELRGIAARVDARFPVTNQGWGVYVETLANYTVGPETASYVWLLLGAVGFLLLIACANVANLQFARALGRSQELALRVALGASRWRLMRQLLTENILLGITGGAVVGIGFAAISIRLILVNMPADVAVFIGGWDRISLNAAALWFTLATAIVAGMLAGLAPAWHAARPQLNATLKEGGRGAIGHSRRRLRAALVVAQVALALILLVGAGLMVQGFRAVAAGGAGYEPDRTLTAVISLPHSAHFDAVSTRGQFYQQVLERLRALPGVTGAATARFLPLGGGYNEDGFSIEGRPIQNASQQRYAVQQVISPNFFALLHIPLLSGRAFTASDGTGSPPVVIINQRLAQHYFPGRSPLGEQLKLGGESSTGPWMTVVGVVPNLKWNWYATSPVSTLYTPVSQEPNHVAFFLLRSSASGDVTALGPAMRQAVAAVDPVDPLSQVESLRRFIHEASIGIAYVSVMLSVAGLLALVLAAIGIYGVMAFLVGERKHEFGIRRALGASHGDLVMLVFRRGGAMLGLGLVIGIPLAYGAARMLQGLIVGAGAGDVATYALVIVVLAAMAAVACYMPARQAARVDPLTALREP
ncbi:MAG: ABC transporter permease [Terriglobales bacterium]